MDIYEREYITAVVNFFWGKGTATPQTINESAAIVAYEALEEAKVCSDSMDYVPRPTYGASSIKWIIKQLAKIGKRIISGDTKLYDSCKGQVAARYRSKITLALMGM
jgi:hypothetical protein